MISNLIAVGNLKQAHEYLPHLPSSLRSKFETKIRDALPLPKGTSKGDDTITTQDDYPTWGLAHREIYPWNPHEPDRSSPSCLEEINQHLSTVAPRLEARIVELPDLISGAPGGRVVKQLGLFAREDLKAGEEVLREKSYLTATARMNDAFCDGCAVRLPSSALGSSAAAASEESREEREGAVSCSDCETIFCSQDCLDTASELYHPALCDGDFDSLGKDAEAKDAPHALYALLLLRALAMAKHQEVHPLTLPQTKYLWGDFLPHSSSSKPSLPFNIHYNIILPLTMMEKMDINIFEATTEEGGMGVWVLNTLYAKFRGTADARMGLDGKPEIGAVHPMWCLANHDCAPNVGWRWEGDMRFYVRSEEQSVDWRPGTQENSEAEEDSEEEGEEEGEVEVGRGIRKDEQILGHYCDVELPVKERREWARGALGGDCMCERCCWEAANPEMVRSVRIAR